MICDGYSYIFICHCIDKYKRLSIEADTENKRRFAKEQLLMFEEKYKQFKN